MKSLITGIALLALASLFSCRNEPEDTPTCHPDQLIGFNWKLTKFGDESAPGNLLPGVGTVTFIAQPDSLFFANDGCNNTDGTYTINQDCGISFYNVGTTLAYCGPLIPTPESIAINNQRHDIIVSLASGGAFSVTDESLTIRTTIGKLLVYVRD